MPITIRRQQFPGRSILSQFSGFVQLQIQGSERSPWVVFVQVVRGHPGGRLQLSGGGSKITWLASAFSSILARCPKKEKNDKI